eukprot:3292236-Pleurochrysis_carterae.AAC.1
MDAAYANPGGLKSLTDSVRMLSTASSEAEELAFFEIQCNPRQTKQDILVSYQHEPQPVWKTKHWIFVLEVEHGGHGRGVAGQLTPFCHEFSRTLK